MTTVYFVRHGATEFNRTERFQGATDVPLDDFGQAQAGYLGERFRDVPLNAVYASPLIRARQTAQGVCKFHPELTPIADSGLCEIHCGVLEGRFVSELRAEYPDVMDIFQHRPAAFAPPGGETAYQVHIRMGAAIRRIVESNPGKTLAVVSHGFALLTYLGALDRPFDELRPMLFGNAAVACVEYDDFDHFRVRFVDDQSHLPPEARFHSKLFPKKDA